MAFNFKKTKTTSKGFFSEEDQLRVSNAIVKAEITTSGEIRVFVEDNCPHADPVLRAEEIFYILKLDKTQLRNGVLVYMSLIDKKAAIYGDKGIYEKTGGADYWNEEFDVFVSYLSKGELIEGIERVVSDLGYSLAEYFPYREDMDKNELPDEMVFGEDLK